MHALVFLSLIFTLISPSLASADQVLMSDGTISVDAVDLDALLDDASTAGQLKLLTNRTRVNNLVEQLYLTRVLAAEARAHGLLEEPLANAKLERMVNNYLLKLRLEEMDAAPVPDLTRAVREYYEAHKEKYKEKAQVHASHILIALRNHKPEQAEALALKVRERALTGEDFTALAVEFSEDPSAKQNKGDLGWFTRGRMVKPFADAAFAMHKPGEISPLVRSKFGFHIIRFEAGKAAAIKPFDAVKEGIHQQLETEYKTERRHGYFDQIKSREGVKLNEPALDAYIAAQLEKLEAKSPDASPEGK